MEGGGHSNSRNQQGGGGGGGDTQTPKISKVRNSISYDSACIPFQYTKIKKNGKK